MPNNNNKRANTITLIPNSGRNEKNFERIYTSNANTNTNKRSKSKDKVITEKNKSNAEYGVKG